MATDGHDGMPLSEKIRNLGENAIAISPILRRFGGPGLIGLLLIGLGLWQDMTWLTIAGIILAAPVIWCYVVLIVVYPLLILFCKPQQRHWKE